MSRKIIHSFLFILFPLYLSGCVTFSTQPDFDKQQAAKARVELALGYLNQNLLTQAKLNLDKALQYAPDYFFTHAALAYFYQQQGDIVQAKQSYEKAIKLDKNQGDVRNNYGVLLCTQGEFNAAYMQFEQALHTPNYYHQAETYENIALCAIAEPNHERYEKSLIMLQKLDKTRAEKIVRLKR